MSGFLLDTNVISELTRANPDSGVVAFLTRERDTWLSSVVLHELEFGTRLLPPGRWREDLTAFLAAILAEFEDRILALEHREAAQAAAFRAHARLSGRILQLGDALIAGTARTHRLAVATRNVGDFEGLDVEVINPWA